MGGYISAFYTPTTTSAESDTTTPTDDDDTIGTRDNRKRQRAVDTADSDQTEDDSYLLTPKKKKMKSTTEYIYQVLFIDGENSDITISTLGKEWKLHKLYLKQCGYFESMFNRSWKETEQTRVTIDIPDNNINAEALTIAFGCLYRDDFTVEPVKVVSVLAAASLLQLEGLLNQCALIMKETISAKTVCQYHDSSVIYGVKSVEEACFEWFENNIMCKQSRNLLKHISSSLMLRLVKSPNLFVMQVEMDIYNLLKRWMFLQLVPSWSGNFKSGLTKQADAHFRELVKREFGSDSERAFLETGIGARYRRVFAQLRLQHILIDLTSSLVIMKDRLLPTEWLAPFYKANWLAMLNTEQQDVKGPAMDRVSSDTFLKHSLRCARVLLREAEHQWRWIGFNFGMDLVVMYTNRLIIFKRNNGNASRLLSNQANRSILFRVTVSSLNELGQVTYSKSSGIKSYLFSKDEELLCISVDKKATMPLRIGLNVLYNTPMPEFSVDNLLHIPLNSDKTCIRCDSQKQVAAVSAVHSSSSDTEDDSANNLSGTSQTITGVGDRMCSSTNAAVSDNEYNLLVENPLL